MRRWMCASQLDLSKPDSLVKNTIHFCKTSHITKAIKSQNKSFVFIYFTSFSKMIEIPHTVVDVLWAMLQAQTMIITGFHP